MSDRDDAVCVSAVEVTYPDGDKSIVFGDVPVKVCG